MSGLSVFWLLLGFVIALSAGLGGKDVGTSYCAALMCFCISKQFEILKKLESLEN